MADDQTVTLGDATRPAEWRGFWLGLGSVVAALALAGLIFAIAWSTRARDEALEWERRTYEVMLLTRSVDATIARSEAALGRYVLDERQETGTAYYLDWRSAGWQIAQLARRVRGDPDQQRRIAELEQLFGQRGRELAPAATAAERQRGAGGLSILYQASKSGTLPALRNKLEEIAEAERIKLAQRTAVTRSFVNRADELVEWLGWLALLMGLGAVGLALMAYRALKEGDEARGEADLEAWRASELGQAVAERTRELSQAYERLQAESADRAAAEAQLRQIQKMEAVGQLTGGIAHDFNNMLAVVVGGLDLAKRKLKGTGSEAEPHIDSALEGATRAAALTRRLLAFARAEPLLPEAVTPAKLLGGMLELIDRSIGERIAVKTRPPLHNWHVWADPTQLENAILNLCVNARDAMDGTGEIEIAVDNVRLEGGALGELPPGEYVRISVTDSGAGIPPEHLERVFEPFFTTKPVGKGTGLGLSQIFGFARQSGGDVTIESRVGAGTTVRIWLPRAVDLAVEPGADSGDDLAAPSSSIEAVAGARILVVEDDPRVSRSTMAALRELGHQPIASAGGREALEILEREDVALVITDVMMPEMTGPELAREVAARHPHVRLLFVTGYVGEAGEAEDLSGHEILRKPFTVNKLANAVHHLLAAPLSAPRPPAASAAAE